MQLGKKVEKKVGGELCHTHHRVLGRYTRINMRRWDKVAKKQRLKLGKSPIYLTRANWSGKIYFNPTSAVGWVANLPAVGVFKKQARHSKQLVRLYKWAGSMLSKIWRQSEELKNWSQQKDQDHRLESGGGDGHLIREVGEGGVGG